MAWRKHMIAAWWVGTGLDTFYRQNQKTALVSVKWGTRKCICCQDLAKLTLNGWFLTDILLIWFVISKHGQNIHIKIFWCRYILHYMLLIQRLYFTDSWLRSYYSFISISKELNNNYWYWRIALHQYICEHSWNCVLCLNDISHYFPKQYFTQP